MKTHIALGAATLALVLMPGVGHTQSVDPDREILAARDTVWRAWFSNDTALLRRFIPPAAAVVEGAEQKWSDRKEILDGARGLASSGVQLVDVKFANTEIQRVGHSALVRSNYRVVTRSGARADTSRGRATELFVRQGATWVNPYWQLEPNAVGAPRDIPLADTLGASFSIADSAAGKASLTDYDRLVGTWEFRFQSRAPDGSFLPPFDGHWTFDKRPGGGLIEDHWRPDDPSSPMGNSLYTYRTFDPKRRIWFMLGASSRGGEVEPGLTWADDKSLYAIQRNGNSLSRIRYTFLSDDHFVWRSDVSRDEGKTWMRDAGMMEARRIAK
jgi:hypothetical protein